MRITKEIALEGINRARCPRACRYTDEQGTCCVAAHIIELIGVKIPGIGDSGNDTEVHAVYRTTGYSELLSDEEIRFLQGLQRIWDGNYLGLTKQETEEELKEIMRDYVNDYFDKKTS